LVTELLVTGLSVAELSITVLLVASFAQTL
jgi:hypothetical protein